MTPQQQSSLSPAALVLHKDYFPRFTKLFFRGNTPLYLKLSATHDARASRYIHDCEVRSIILFAEERNMKSPITFDVLRGAFANGEINSATKDELWNAIGVLANREIPNEWVRHEALIMSEGIHNILLCKLLDEQERRNNRIQFWFIVLAVASVLSGIAQVLVALIR
jgi:hypothetical protein